MRTLDRERAALVVVDVQEAFRPAVDGFDEVVENTRRLIEGARILGIPTVVTEQYPKGLGHTVEELGEVEPVEKTCFSAARAEGFDLDGRDQALVCGIETHVCVSQTAHDLLERGVEVHVASDAVTSRTAANRQVGLHKMEQSGAIVTSVETALFELLGVAGTDEFKQVQGLIKVSAYLLLEDGTRFDGDAVGAHGQITGEVVFNTAMSGYQESVTDPSYRGQIIVFTYPHIGNYGVSTHAMESDSIHARGVVMREAIDREDAAAAEGGWLTWLDDCGVPAITGVDTRALVRHIRDKGSMRGGIFPGDTPEAEARDAIDAEPSMKGRDLACEVTPGEAVVFEGDGPRVIAIDTGIKGSIIRNMRERGVHLELHPCRTSADDLMARNPDAVFLANGPGDPAALDYVVENVRDLVGKVPVWGICLGHQLLCRAVGLETFKLPFGHRGANHPVKDLETGRIDITSQNHGFAVLGPDGARTIDTDEPVRWETDFGAAELSQLNLYDRTVEGLVLRDVPASTVQYHPEAGPGPHDSLYLFDRFLEKLHA